MPATDYTRITVYLTEEEKTIIQAQADRAGLKLSSYIKNQLLGDNQMTTPQTDLQSTLTKARNEIQVLINTLLSHAPMDSVMTEYPKAGERLQNTLNKLRPIRLPDKYGQAGKTILRNQIEALESLDIDTHSEDLLGQLGDIVKAIDSLKAGISLV